MEMKTESIKKRKYGIMLVAFILVIIGYFCVTLFGLRADIRAQAAENESICAQIEEQSEKNAELESIIQSEDKNAYIERKARENGYAGADERVYYAADAS